MDWTALKNKTTVIKIQIMILADYGHQEIYYAWNRVTMPFLRSFPPTEIVFYLPKEVAGVSIITRLKNSLQINEFGSVKTVTADPD